MTSGAPGADVKKFGTRSKRRATSRSKSDSSDGDADIVPLELGVVEKGQAALLRWSVKSTVSPIHYAANHVSLAGHDNA